EHESALSLYEPCKVRTVKAGTLEKLVEPLVPAFQGSDLSYVTVFLCTYRAFTTTQQVLDLLFKSRYGRCDALTASSRYGCIFPYSDEDGGPQDQLKNAISSILGTWLDQYSEDFCQPPDFPCLKQLVAYAQLNMPGSDLERRAHLLLAQLEHAELPEAEPEALSPAPAPVLKPAPELEPAPAPSLVPAPELKLAPATAPAPALELEPDSLPPHRQQAQAPARALHSRSHGEPVCLLSPAGARSKPQPSASIEAEFPYNLPVESELQPWALPRAAGPWVSRSGMWLGLLTPRLPEPQELFEKVAPCRCLGSIRSQWDRKGKGQLAPTVIATVTQVSSAAS
ncbi:GNDS protein, partial [Crocuta crocuta]